MSWSSTLSRKFSVSSFSLASANNSLASRNSKSSHSSKELAKVTELGTKGGEAGLDEAFIRPVHCAEDAENPFGDQHALSPSPASKLSSNLELDRQRTLQGPPSFPINHKTFSALSNTPPLQNLNRKSAKLIRRGPNGKSSKKIGGKSLRGLKKVASLVFGTTYSSKGTRNDAKEKGKSPLIWQAEVRQDVNTGITRWEQKERELQGRYLDEVRLSFQEETELVITAPVEDLSRPGKLTAAKPSSEIR